MTAYYAFIYLIGSHVRAPLGNNVRFARRYGAILAGGPSRRALISPPDSATDAATGRNDKPPERGRNVRRSV
jgi:hypothetical protein